MSFIKVATVVIGTTIALAVVGTVAWFAHLSAVFQETCVKGYKVAEAIHEKLLESEAYRCCDVGNRVIWITTILDPALDKVCIDLDEEKKGMVKRYVFNSLETICSTN